METLFFERKTLCRESEVCLEKRKVYKDVLELLSLITDGDTKTNNLPGATNLLYTGVKTL